MEYLTDDIITEILLCDNRQYYIYIYIYGRES